MCSETQLDDEREDYDDHAGPDGLPVGEQCEICGYVMPEERP